MNKKIMLINATDPEEIRVATLVEGLLSDFDIEFVHNEKIKGNIYKAKVVRVDTSLQAAFVHFGGQKNGFLPIGELPRDLVSPEGRRGRIQDLLLKDQEIMVQAVREELGTKGAMMTAQISLPGRYLVLTPGNPLNGISRKIESREEREYFKRLIDELDIPKNFGVIVRTASLGVTKEDFERDLEYLMDTYKEVQSRYKHRRGPGLVWQEDDVVTRTLRDGFSSDVEEVHIDDLETFHQAQAFFKRTMPQFQHVLKHYVGKRPIFSKHQTEEQIDRIFARRVSLPSGGALVLDQTEALVAVDVNSGKTTGEGVEDMAFRTNMEAAEEAARQLRLRDLAGLIVIDFIDMKREQHNKAVMDRLVECLKEDKARMEVGKINRFGVLVMTRQRLRPSIQHVTHAACPTCQGTGQVKSMESMVISVIRRLKSALSREGIGEIRVKLAPAIALAVLNHKRKDLFDLEETHEVKILIQADAEIGYGEMAAEIERRDEEAEKTQARLEKATDTEEETVVLAGDAPISFEKALGGKAEKTDKADGGRDADRIERRDVQRAVLAERERLRSLFESAKPGEEGPALNPRSTPTTTLSRGGRQALPRGRGRGRVIRDRDPFAGVSGAISESPNAVTAGQGHEEPLSAVGVLQDPSEAPLSQSLLAAAQPEEERLPLLDVRFTEEKEPISAEKPQTPRNSVESEPAVPVFNSQLLLDISRPKLFGVKLSDTDSSTQDSNSAQALDPLNPESQAAKIGKGTDRPKAPAARRGRPKKSTIETAEGHSEALDQLRLEPSELVVPLPANSEVKKNAKKPASVQKKGKASGSKAKRGPLTETKAE